MTEQVDVSLMEGFAPVGGASVDYNALLKKAVEIKKVEARRDFILDATIRLAQSALQRDFIAKRDMLYYAELAAHLFDVVDRDSEDKLRVARDFRGVAGIEHPADCECGK